MKLRILKENRGYYVEIERDGKWQMTKEYHRCCLSQESYKEDGNYHFIYFLTVEEAEAAIRNYRSKVMAGKPTLIKILTFEDELSNC